MEIPFCLSLTRSVRQSPFPNPKPPNTSMKTIKPTKKGGKSKVEIVVRAADGHTTATAPIVELAPIDRKSVV